MYDKVKTNHPQTASNTQTNQTKDSGRQKPDYAANMVDNLRVALSNPESPPDPNTIMQLQKTVGNRATMQFLSGTLQRKKENRTGLPDHLKAGVESLSGLSMDDVKVHYHSDKPARVGALAYTQGTDIHVATGQERHLAHEAWHVVQQKQGRVRPTMQLKRVQINDDSALEREADIMGARALGSRPADHSTLNRPAIGQNIVQRWKEKEIFKTKKVPWTKTSKVTTIGDLNRHVCFFYDSPGKDPLVVKAGRASDEDPGLFNLIADFQDQVGMKSSRMFREYNNSTLTGLINSKADDDSFTRLGQNEISRTKASKAPITSPSSSSSSSSSSTTTGTTPTTTPTAPGTWGIRPRSGSQDQADLLGSERKPKNIGIKVRVDGFNANPIFVSSYARGIDVEKMAEQTSAGTAKKNILDYLGDAKYLYQVGLLSAVDYFLGFQDRAASGNLGNWMIDEKGEITLIDNIDRQLKNTWQKSEEAYQNPIAADDLINSLSSANIKQTAEDIFDQMARRMKMELLQKVMSPDDYLKPPLKAKKDKELGLSEKIAGYKGSAVPIILKGLLEGRKKLVILAKETLEKKKKGKQSLADTAWQYGFEDALGNAMTGGINKYNYQAELIKRMQHLISQS